MREDRRGPPNIGVGAVVDQASEWAAFDALLGIEVEGAPDATVGTLAFYGRCSTEDNQDPETSKAWQLSNAAKFVRPLGGVIVAEFFDIGQSARCPGSVAMPLLSCWANCATLTVAGRVWW